MFLEIKTKNVISHVLQILTGAKECVEGAKARLLEIIDDLEQMTEIQCIIEQKHHRSILGNKGKYVQDICAKYSVQIKFPDRRKQMDESASPEPESPSETRDIIMVIGKKENAENARNALMVSFSKNKRFPPPHCYSTDVFISFFSNNV